jgi:uncharacterized OB-fold protein
MTTKPFPVPTGQRPLPLLNRANREYWSGSDGKLWIQQCTACHYYVHPPVSICPRCLSLNVTPSAVSGEASLFSYTINKHAWYSTFPAEFVLGTVQLVEQPDLIIGTGIVNCAADELEIGMPLRVYFQKFDDVALPYFEPTP